MVLPHGPESADGFPLAGRVARRLDTLVESASTNADLRGLAQDASWPHLSVLVTTNQTAGRGRLNRAWTTPTGTALAISVLLRDLPARLESRAWLPLVAGVAMADAVAAQLPDHDVGVKWPNDVLVDGRKICGILAEVEGSAIVVGAGVNTTMTAQQLPVATATSFAVVGAVADEDRLLADYLARLDALLKALVAVDDALAAGVHAVVAERCLTLGRGVVVSMPDGSVLRGTASGLDAYGRLEVDAEGVRRTVSAGDVVHARLD